MTYHRLPRSNVVRGRFGERRPRQSKGWLSPDDYLALSRDEKMALAMERRGGHARRSPWRYRKGHYARQRWAWLAVVMALGALGGFDWLIPNVEPSALLSSNSIPATPSSVSFGLCHSGGGTNCVVDGDTIWLNGQNIRIADIDTPETHEPRCAEEQALGDRATARLHQLVNSGAVTLSSIDRDEDSYGRKLRIVEVGGTSVGETLVGEGLARWYDGGRRSWCA